MSSATPHVDLSAIMIDANLARSVLIGVCACTLVARRSHTTVGVTVLSTTNAVRDLQYWLGGVRVPAYSRVDLCAGGTLYPLIYGPKGPIVNGTIDCLCTSRPSNGEGQVSSGVSFAVLSIPL